MSTRTYCRGDADVCGVCGQQIAAPNQICRGPFEDPDEPVELDEPLTRRDWRTMWQYAESRLRYYQRRAALPINKAHPNGSDTTNARLLVPLVAALDAVAGDLSIDANEPIRLGIRVTRREWRMLLDAAHWRRVHHGEKLDQLDRLEPLLARAAGEG